MNTLSYNYLDRVRDLKGREDAYTVYLQTEFYQKKLKEVFDSSNKNIVDTILKCNHDSTKSFGQIDGRLSEMNNNLIDGFDEVTSLLGDVNYNLSELDSELNHISGILDWGFNTLIENQRINNILMMNIAGLLKIPEFEKERIYYIEEGLKYLRNALFDIDLYSYAEESFKQALLRKSTDFFTLFRLGLIHLFSPQHIDFIKAKDYLEKSIKFLKPELIHNTGFERSALQKKNLEEHQSQNYSASDVKKQASIILYYLGNTHMLIGNTHLLTGKGEYVTAKGYFLEALKLVPSFSDAKYQLCKANFLLSDLNYTVELETLISENPLYYIKAKYDLDFKNNKIASDKIQAIYNQKERSVNDKINEIKNNILEASSFTPQINEVITLSKKGYFGFIKAEKKMNEEMSIKMQKPDKDSKYDLETRRLNFTTAEVSGNLLRMVQYESKFRKSIIEREMFFHENISSFIKREEKKNKDYIRSEAQKEGTQLIIKILIILGFVIAALHIAKTVKSSQFVYRVNIINDIGIFVFFKIFPIYSLIWIGFAVFIALITIKRVFNSSRFNFINGESVYYLCIIFSDCLGIFFAYENWQERMVRYNDVAGETIGFILSLVVFVVIFSIIGAVLGFLLKTSLKDD